MVITSEYSYIIVGSGVFGASTAYHLSRAHPEAKIALLDRSESFPCPLAASHDFNKIVRADYGNGFYCKLALEARESWKSERLYRPFYHESGMVVLDDTGLARRIVKNYEELKAYSEAVIVRPDEFIKMYGKLFEDADYRGVEEVFVNPLSGWAEATKAVRAVIEAAIENGVEYVKADIKKLNLDLQGACTGVQTSDGRNFTAANVILSTGAGTAKLLADSAASRKVLQAEDRIIAAAVVTGIVNLSVDQIAIFEKAPIFIHSVGEVQGINTETFHTNSGSTKLSPGEVLAPTPEGVLKFCVDVSFKNTTLHERSGQNISAPPNHPDQEQHNVSQILKDECARVVRGIYGKTLEYYQFDSFRICW